MEHLAKQTNYDKPPAIRNASPDELLARVVGGHPVDALAAVHADGMALLWKGGAQ
jgi:hypothetical protein